ncbi:hypothetical protein, partial [Mycolicibacterium vulneris]|uniref:hypothetical protein n=1 Tax=Mycolicibacterium vulneris TaxID=547163 RepID=UPI001C65A913
KAAVVVVERIGTHQSSKFRFGMGRTVRCTSYFDQLGLGPADGPGPLHDPERYAFQTRCLAY